MSLGSWTGQMRVAECSRCDQVAPHRQVATAHGNVWLADAHAGPCGLPCVGGPVAAPATSHGYQGRCPVCTADVCESCGLRLSAPPPAGHYPCPVPHRSKEEP